MADAPPDDAKSDAPDGEKKAGGKLGGPAKIAGLVLTVMLVEAGVLYVLLAPAEAAAVEELPSWETEEVAEVPLEPFATTNARAVPGRLTHLSFTLTAVVPASRSAEFAEAAEGGHQARLRQAVLEVARAADADALDDPRLTDFKRSLTDAMNVALREDLVRGAVVSEFKALEQ